MKKLLFLALIAISGTLKSQVSTVLLSTGIPAFIGSSVYYAIGEPTYDVSNNTQANFNAYNQRLTRYKNVRTISMIGSSALLLSGVILKSAEIKATKNSSINISPTGVQYTIKW